MFFSYCAAIASYLAAPASWHKTTIYFVHRICGSDIKTGYTGLCLFHVIWSLIWEGSVAECDLTALLAGIIWGRHHSCVRVGAGYWLHRIWAIGWSPWMYLSFFTAW